MRTVEAARSAVDRARAEGYDFSCPRCGSLNSVRIAAYGGGKPEDWFARCFRCNQSFRIKKKAKEEENVAMEVYQPAEQVRPEAPAATPEEKLTPLECLERGLPLEKAKQMRKEDLTPEAALKLLTAGVSVKEVGRLYGIPNGSTYRLITSFGLRYNKMRQAWEAGGAPEKKTQPAPGGAGPALEDALSGVACPVPDNAQVRQIWSDISRLDGAFKVLDGLVEELAKDVKLLMNNLTDLRGRLIELTDRIARLQVESLTALVNEIDERLQDLENDYRHHRHQTSAGKWSGKAET